MSVKQNDAKHQLRVKKAMKRRFITWTRMIRYGVNNFTRNAWLTTAATAVMTITLLIILVAVSARVLLGNVIVETQQKVDIPISLNPSATTEQIDKAEKKLKSQPYVKNVTFISIEEAKQNYIEKNKPSPETMQAIANAPRSPFWPEFRVVLNDSQKTASLENLVTNDTDIKTVLNPDPRRTPDFKGNNKKVIDTISGWIKTAQTAGLVAGAIFVGISMLIIFNTIRMAIFNRRDEIEMMKLIGADKSFISGPFVVEASMYGFIAAILATVIGCLSFVAVEPSLNGYGIATNNISQAITGYWWLIVLAVIVTGVFIGIISSRLAVHKYLRNQ